MGEDFDESWDGLDTETGSEDFSENLSIPDDIPDDIPSDLPDDIPDDIPSDLPDDIPDDIFSQGYIDSPVLNDGTVDPVAIEGYEQASEVNGEIEASADAHEETAETPETPQESERPAFDAMTEYMAEHNYGREDAAEYMNDPEWQALNRDLQEEDGIERDPMQDMQEYMSNHDYGLGDTPEFHQDPEWQEINNRILESEGAEPVNYDDMIPGESEESFEEIPDDEDVPGTVETTEEEPEVEPETLEEVPEAVSEEAEEEPEAVSEEAEEEPEAVSEEAEEEPEALPEEVEEEPEAVPEEVEEEPEAVSEEAEEEPEAVPEEPEIAPEQVAEDPEDTEQAPEEVPETQEETESPEDVEAVSEHPAMDAMAQYMQEHNYGLEDAEVYRQDPEWQRLNNDYLIESGMDPVEYGSGVEQTESGTEVVDGVAQELEMGDFETMVSLEDPDFYTSGEFLEQGINEYGYNGTCGETTQANSLNRLFETNRFTENSVLEVAVSNGLCDVSDDPDACGGTTTENFIELYEKMDEQMGGDKIEVECFDYDQVLTPEQVAQEIESGSIVNVAVDAGRLWDEPQNYVDKMGNPIQQLPSDHWIAVSGVNRDSGGEIVSFDIIDSGGGETNVSLEKYVEMCYGSRFHTVTDPTAIVVSRKDKV